MNAINQAKHVWMRAQLGATSIEYALIAGLISVAVIAGAAALGVNIGGLFSAISYCMTNPVAGCMTAS